MFRNLHYAVLAALVALPVGAYVHSRTSAGMALVRAPEDAADAKFFMHENMVAGATNGEGQTVISADSDPLAGLQRAAGHWDNPPDSFLRTSIVSTTDTPISIDDGVNVIAIANTPAARAAGVFAIAITFTPSSILMGVSVVETIDVRRNESGGLSQCPAARWSPARGSLSAEITVCPSPLVAPATMFSCMKNLASAASSGARTSAIPADVRL